MASRYSLPSRADFLKLQVKHAVVGDVTAIGAALQKLDALGSEAYANVNPKSPKNLFKFAELAAKLKTEILAFQSKHGKKHPKFCSALEREYVDRIDHLVDLAHDLRNVSKRIDEFASEAEKGLSHTQNACEGHPIDAKGFAQIASMLKESVAAIRELSKMIYSVSLATESANFKEADASLTKIEGETEAMRNYALQKAQKGVPPDGTKEPKLAAGAKKNYQALRKIRMMAS